MDIIAIALPKGGTGKTTTTIQLAASFARAGRRVLVIDLDPQGHATDWLLGGEPPPASGALQVLIEDAAVHEVAVPTLLKNVDLCGADGSLNKAELALVSEMARETFLRKALAQSGDRWDVVLLDCPPAMGLLVANALTAATHVLSPVVPSYFSLKGVREFEQRMQAVRANLNPNLARLGFLLCAVDNREAIASDVRNLLMNFAPEHLLSAEVRVDTRMKLGHSTERTRAVLDYDKVAKELTKRLSAKPKQAVA